MNNENTNKTVYHRDPYEERWLLGAILRYGVAQYKPAAWLQVEDFLTRKHQLIWRAIQDLDGAGTDPDRLAVYRKCEEWNELGEIGGISGLLDVEPNCPEIIDPGSLAKRIRNERLARDVHVTFDALSDEAKLRVESPSSLIGLAESRIQDFKDLSIPAGVKSFGQRLVVHGGLKSFLKNAGKLVDTPWSKLRRETGGMKRGELWLIAARPSMGKTALALNLALDAARRGNPAAFFSIEMSAEMIQRRMYAMVSGVSLRDIATGELSDADIAAIDVAHEHLDPLPLRIFDEKLTTVADITAAVDHGFVHHGEQKAFDLVVVDYLGLLKSPGADKRYEEISAISKALKRLAKDANIPVVALAQLNREVEKRVEKRPQLQDLRDSGSLEEDADVVAFLYREGYYKRNDPALANTAELMVLKNRNGRLATIPLTFNREIGLFTDVGE